MMAVGEDRRSQKLPLFPGSSCLPLSRGTSIGTLCVCVLPSLTPNQLPSLAPVLKLHAAVNIRTASLIMSLLLFEPPGGWLVGWFCSL